MRLDSLKKLAEGLGRPSHDYRSTLQTFADLSVEETARQMKLVPLAEENGKLDLPSASTTSFDEIESSITERIFSERKSAHQTLIDQLETYAQRLRALDFHGRFTTIQQHAPLTVSEFVAEAKLGRDELFRLRRSVVEHENERDEFKREHKLRRAPQVPTTAGLWLKISLLIFLFLVETYVNGLFLAKGNEYGIIGGVIEAFVFAVLNVLVSFFLGVGAIRQLNHSGILRKLVGLFSLGFWFVFILALNLSLAHYREISGTIYEDAGIKVITSLLRDPLGLHDLKSWLFYAVGIVFSVAAMVDGVLFTDPFPGFAALEVRVKKSHEGYIQRKTDLIGDLKDIRDEAAERMEEAQDDLRKRRAEYTAILDGRARIVKLFEEHQSQLARAGNALLSKYRAANIKKRKTAAPKHFDEQWKFDREAVVAEIPDGLLHKNLDDEIRSSNELLRQQIVAIHEAFDDAVERYRQVDDLIPDEVNGSSKV